MSFSLTAWRRAMAMQDYSVGAWAIDRGLKGHAAVSRELSGEKTISLKAIAAAPIEVQRWYHLFCLEELGLPPEVAAGARIQEALDVLAQSKEATSEPEADRDDE